MCGIAGIFCLKRNECDTKEYSVLIKKMTDAIAHRGPDGEGHQILDHGNVFLGHRRLAIIDLSDAAKQPMQSLDGRYTITYNGELYNYKELKAKLSELGYKFFSNSDTEVVLNAYAEWGYKALDYFNGIFAFAIWDDYQKKIFLACDRYGTKPLYYSIINNDFVFSSEYKSIIMHPGFKKNIDFCSLKQYFTFQNMFDNRTFFENINILSPGSYVEVSYYTKRINEIQYWDYDFTECESLGTYEECKEQLDALFKQAVKRQLISDVEVGAYLSGGMDSGSITAVASKDLCNLKTFVCGFDLHSASGIELSFDERERAEYMSYCFGTEHYEMVLKAGDMERCIKDLVWHIEDPRVGQSYPNYYATKLASSFVKVVLAGTGGDELFGGYPWRYYRAADCMTWDDYVSRYYSYWQRMLSDKELDTVFDSTLKNMEEYNLKDIFGNVFSSVERRGFSPAHNVNYSLYFEAKTFLRGLLVVDDKLSMSKGLETRVPFLDNDLVDFAMKLPVKYKLNNLREVVKINENDYEQKNEKYFKKTNDGKIILRNVMNKYIPESITQATKQGFSAPDASWFKGESIEFVKSIVDNSNSKIYDYMDYKGIRDIVYKHFCGKENRRLLIWSLINFEEWLNLFL